MNINRHNYEEYFLLYIDNELSVDQKKQVELFVKENPDVEEELVMLQQARLIPDNAIVFDKKTLLIKEENDSFINLKNYEEWLVLYVDDELNEEGKMAVEKFAASHSHVQQELNLFQHTKLQPEKIVFADNEILYRKEKVRVISMQWRRVAVAAILIIAAGIPLFSILNNKNNNRIARGEVVNTETKKEPPSNQVKSITPNNQKQTAPSLLKEEKEQITVTTPITKELNKKKKQPEKQRNQEDSQQFASNETNNNQTGTHERVISEINDIQTAKPQIHNAVAIDDKMHKENFNNDTVTTEGPKSPNVRYIADNNGNKKFRGFFRKATRFIERTTKMNPANDDGKLLIGAMAVSLK